MSQSDVELSGLFDRGLSEENQEALDDLLTAIEANGNRLGIFIAACDDSRLQTEIIERYENSLTYEGFRHYRLTLPKEEPSLKRMVAEQVEGDDYLRRGGLAVMSVLGAQRLSSLRGDQERSEQEVFFGYLQWTREGLREFPFAIVLWVTHQMMEKLSRKAPDFWSWRRDVVRFTSPKRGGVLRAYLMVGSDLLLPLPEEVGNTIPVDDLETLIAETVAKDPLSSKLPSLHAQAGKVYGSRVRGGAAADYGTEMANAVRHLESALRMRISSEETEEYASNLAWLAMLYESQGRYEEAEPLLLQALDIGRKMLGEGHLSVATRLSNLAGLYESQSRYEEAEPLLLQALDMLRKALGEEHPDVASSLNNLAGLYGSQSRYEEAEPLHLQALEISRKALGEEHPDVASSLNNLAGLYGSQSRYEEAEPLLLQALEISRKALGEEHPDVAISLNNLAGLYRNQGRYEEAEPLHLQALEIGRNTLGEKHPYVATWLNNLGALYFAMGRYKETEPLFSHSLRIREMVLPAEHLDIVNTRGWLEMTRSHLNPTPLQRIQRFFKKAFDR